MKFFLTVLLFFATLLPQATEAKVCQVGDQAEVLWRGTWYPATVLKTGKNGCFIHYTGYGDSWNEWVGPARIRILETGVVVTDQPAADVRVGAPYTVGDAVLVLWNGSWYPAHVLKAKGSKLFIHYDGYNSNWDEWVGPSRYKRP